MVTPFDDAGALDVDGAVTLARWLVEPRQRRAGGGRHHRRGPGAVRRRVRRAVAGRGRSRHRARHRRHRDQRHPPHASQLHQAATAAGVDGVLVVTPYYSRPSQAGIADALPAVAAATTLPGDALRHPRARRPQDRARHACCGWPAPCPTSSASRTPRATPAGTARLVAEAPDGFEVYCGDDDLTLALLAVGAVGVVSVAAHWAGDEIGDDGERLRQGRRRHGARSVNARLIESYDFESSDDLPEPAAGQGGVPGPRPARRASAGCPSAPRRPSSTSRARTVLGTLGR